MTTAIDYYAEKKGYVLVDKTTDEFFRIGEGLGEYSTTPDLSAAYFFSAKSKALAAARKTGEDRWLVVPSTVTNFLEMTKAVGVGKRRCKMKK